MSKGVPCTWMRGGTSKGAYFIEKDLPKNRDKFLMKVMGSPDPRQINGVGGGDPLTSKVAVVRKSKRKNVDVDFLFLQVAVDKPIVSDSQNCGNILAGVAPFAIEKKLVRAKGKNTNVAIYMQNTGQVAIANVEVVKGMPKYDGNVKIDGVPTPAAPIPLTFKNTEGSTCGSLLPTGNATDKINGVDITMIDNGMPVIVINAKQLGIKGNETKQKLDQNTNLKKKIESIRLKCGKLMNLGDVRNKTIPKITIVSKSKSGTINTRTFIPHKCHASIGVLGAVSVATACLTKDSVANKIAKIPNTKIKKINVEHPSGKITIIAKMKQNKVESAAILRTAKKIFEGTVYE